jgi:hypothetical protein
VKRYGQAVAIGTIASCRAAVPAYRGGGPEAAECSTCGGRRLPIQAPTHDAGNLEQQERVDRRLRRAGPSGRDGPPAATGEPVAGRRETGPPILLVSAGHGLTPPIEGGVKAQPAPR